MTSQPENEKIFTYLSEAVLQYSLLATLAESEALLHESAAAMHTRAAESYQQLIGVAPQPYLKTFYIECCQNEKLMALIETRRAKAQRKRVETLRRYAVVINPFTRSDITLIEKELPHIVGLHDTIEVESVVKEGVKDATD